MCLLAGTKRWENRITPVFGEKNTSKYDFISFLRGYHRSCYKYVIHFGELEGIAGAAVRFGNLWEERVLPRIFWMHNAAKFGRTLGAFRNRNTWVCACVCVRDEVCCGAARWRVHKSPCVRGNTARPSEAERKKRRGHGGDRQCGFWTRLFLSLHPHSRTHDAPKMWEKRSPWYCKISPPLITDSSRIW